MEKALRNRLTFGPMMLAGLFALLILDHAIEGWSKNWRWFVDLTKETGGLQGVGILILLMLILPLATAELAVLFTAERVRPYRLLATLGSGALAIHAFLTQFPAFQDIAASTLAFIIAFVMIGAALRRAASKQTSDAIVRMAGTVLATLYLGGLGWFLMAIRVKHSPHFHGSMWMVLMILLVVKSTDIGAYFGGRALGRHKMIPWLSPGKTWEGLFFGVLTAGGVGAAMGIGLPGHGMAMRPIEGFIFGAIIGAIGQVGDLLESLMKRDAEVKDSGRLIPGFGGVLDVIDSPLFAAPFAYLLLSLFARMR